jgi:hypothetical protein
MSTVSNQAAATQLKATMDSFGMIRTLDDIRLALSMYDWNQDRAMQYLMNNPAPEPTETALKTKRQKVSHEYENARSCTGLGCNVDISDSPRRHTKCYSCFYSSHHSGSAASSSPHPTTVCAFCDRTGHTVDQCPFRLPHDHPDKVIEEPPCGRYIANILGSCLDKSSTSWIRRTEELLGSHTQCMVAGCDGKAEEGAHVWVKGDRTSYFIAALCKRCNHRHGEEEICWCRYISRKEEPKHWIPIRNVWLMKLKWANRDLQFLPFREWCESKPPAHVFRERCCQFCIGGSHRGARHSSGNHISRGGGRTCACGADISDRPMNHKQCLNCFGGHSSTSSSSSSNNSSGFGGGGFGGGFQHQRRSSGASSSSLSDRINQRKNAGKNVGKNEGGRSCKDCGQDISGKPKSHKMCDHCFGGNRRSCDGCGDDISDKPKNHTRCSNCFSGRNSTSSSSSGYRSASRTCDCGADIYDKPMNHTRCSNCFSSRGSTSSSSSSGYRSASRTCACGNDISDKPQNHTRCSNCFSGGKSGKTGLYFKERYK